MKLDLSGPGLVARTAPTIAADAMPVDGDRLRAQFHQLLSVPHHRELLAKRLREFLSGQFRS